LPSGRAGSTPAFGTNRKKQGVTLHGVAPLFFQLPFDLLIDSILLPAAPPKRLAEVNKSS
jgi:hypothetical protein